MNLKEKSIETILGKFHNQHHKKIVLTYWDIRRQIDKISIATQELDIIATYYLSEFLKDKNFNDATQEDMMKWEKWLKEKKDLADSSIDLYEAKIKRFYKYLSNQNVYRKGRGFQRNISYPDNVVWMTTGRNNGNELPIDDILTEEEIMKLLNACKDTREQVIIVSLIDGGLRVSELCSLKIKNIGFDKQLGVFFILPKKGKGLKTGMRKIQLFLIPSSTTYIKKYLNNHNYKDNPDAHFIYSDSNRDRGKRDSFTQMTNNAIWKIVTRIVKNSKMKKNIHPHTLRHLSATYCAIKGFNEFMMRERFGWSNASQMPSHYVHLAQKDSTDYIKKLLGIKEEDKPEESLLQPIICPNCEYENVPTNIICGRCGMKLNIKKEDITMSASDIGVALQKSVDKDQLEQLIGNMVLKKLQELEKKK